MDTSIHDGGKTMERRHRWIEGKGWDIPVDAPGSELPLGFWDGWRFVPWEVWVLSRPMRVDAPLEKAS